MQINPYLHFPGTAEQAFLFYQSAFGGEFTNITRFKEMKNENIGPDEEEKLAHIALPIGSNTLMGSDVPKFMGILNLKENRSKISINLESKQEADRLYALLSIHGEIEMPLAESPWGSYFAMFRDQFGIEWMIDCPL